MKGTSRSPRPMLQSDGGDFSCPFHTKTSHPPCVRRGGDLAPRDPGSSALEEAAAARFPGFRCRGVKRGHGTGAAACRGWILATRRRRRKRRTMPRTALPSGLFLAIAAIDTKAALGPPGQTQIGIFHKILNPAFFPFIFSVGDSR